MASNYPYSYLKNYGADRTIAIQSVGVQGLRGNLQSLSSVPDVDVTFLEDGSVLAYNVATGTWMATNSPNKLNFDLDGGIYDY